MDRVALDLGFIQIYWYSIFIFLGVFFASLVILKEAKKQHINEDFLINLIFYGVIFGLIGARLYYVVFNLEYYLKYPLEILEVWNGGLAIHGGILFGLLTVVIYCRKYHAKTLKVLDILVVGLILGQAIGRWGNYFNSEAYGIPIIGQNWGLFIPEGKRIFEYSNYTLFHPTFLYESICDIFGFAILFMVLRYFGKQYKGLVFFLYLVIYAIIRFFIERIRIDSALNLGSLPIAEIASCCLFVVGIVGMMIILAKKRV